ncbi:MAG: hypothetical protein ACI92Z_000868 [Paracoccaceae bacterium]|jgi:hypothetical protein
MRKHHIQREHAPPLKRQRKTSAGGIAVAHELRRKDYIMSNESNVDLLHLNWVVGSARSKAN